MSLNLEKELECSICHDTYDDPRYLACYHSFCFECVQKLRVVGKCRVSCPLCRKETVLPGSGASGLTKNNLAQIVAGTLGHKKGSPGRHRSAMCQSDGDEHDPPQKAIFYCESCKKAACANCVVIYHRDPIQHPTTHVDVAVVRMKEEIEAMLSHGQEIETNATESRKLLTAKEEDVNTKIAVLESHITSAFSEERKKLKNREKNLTKELKDVRSALTNVLRCKRANSEKKAKSLSELNCLAKDIIQDGACAITEMYTSICEGYESGTIMPTILDETANSLEQISELLSKIHFQKASDMKQTPAIGKINVITGDWLLEQIRYATTMLPSCVAEMSDGSIAIGFETDSDIKVYDKHLQCTQVFGPVAVKHMTPFPDRAILVLTQADDVFRFSSPKQSGTRLFHGANLKKKPRSLTANVEGEFSLMYKDHIEMYNKRGKWLREVSLSLYLDVRSLDMLEVLSGNRTTGSNQRLDLLIKDDTSLKRINIIMNHSKLQINANEVHLPDACPDGQERVITLDSAGNLYVAVVRDNQDVTVVTIKKYCSADLTNEEIVIAELQIIMDKGDCMILSALTPSCLLMSTAQKLSVFRKCTVEQFIS